MVKNVLLLLVVFLVLGLLVGCGDDSGSDELTADEVTVSDPAEEPAEDTVVFADPMGIPENVEAMENILAIITELGERLNAEDGYYDEVSFLLGIDYPVPELEPFEELWSY